MATATKIPVPPPPGVLISPPPAEEVPLKEFHSRLGSISRQSGVYFAGTMLTTAAAYFFKIYLARTLGAEKLGLYALGMTLVGFVGLFNGLGLPTAAARFVADYSARKDFFRLGGFLRASMALLASGNLVLAAAMLLTGPWVVTHFYHSPQLTAYLWAFALIMLVGVLNTFLGQIMAGYQDVSRRTLITHFIGTPANMVVAVILISTGFGLSGYLAAQVASALLVLGLLGFSTWKMTPRPARASGSWHIQREVISFSSVAFGITALQFALAQADKIVLGYYLDAEQVGIYVVASALVGFVPVVLQSVNQIFSPTIAELYASGSQSMLQQLYSTLTKWILILTIPLALTLLIFPHSLMAIFGSVFQGGAAVLAIGTVGQLLNCAVGSVGHLLLMSGNQSVLMRILAVSAALMVCLTVLLVPHFGIAGAAMAAAAGVVVTNVWSLGAVRRRLDLFPYNRQYFRLLAPTFLSVAGLLALSHASPAWNSNWFTLAVAVAMAYGLFVGTVLIFGLDQQDRLFLKAVGSKLASVVGAWSDQ